VAIAAALECGAVGAHHFSGVAPRGPEDRVELVGTRGWLSYDWSRDELRGALGEQKTAEVIPIPDNPRRGWTAEADFIAAIRNGDAVWPSFADGVQYMEFTEAVYRSTESGRIIELPLA
jgi:predicted dehydrogenase